MVNQQRGKERLRGVREPSDLPYQAAPELAVGKKVRGDVDGGEVFNVEDGESDGGRDCVDQERFCEGCI